MFENLKDDDQRLQRSMDTIKEDMLDKLLNTSSSKRDDFLKLIQIPVS